MQVLVNVKPVAFPRWPLWARNGDDSYVFGSFKKLSLKTFFDLRTLRLKSFVFLSATVTTCFYQHVAPDVFLKATKHILRPSQIELYARIVFPLLFLTFQLVYWVILVFLSTQNMAGLILPKSIY